jgi:hypothetical protein
LVVGGASINTKLNIKEVSAYGGIYPITKSENILYGNALTENTNINDCLDEIEATNTFNKNSNINYETVSNSETEFLTKWEIIQPSDLYSVNGELLKCYIDRNNFVRLVGSYSTTVTKSSAFLLFNLPIQFRPSTNLFFPIIGSVNWNIFPSRFTTNQFIITINTNGNVTVNTNAMSSGVTEASLGFDFDSFVRYNKNI